MDDTNFCPYFNDCVSIFGDSSVLLIIGALLVSDKRFNELQRSIDGISPTTLSDRLKKLESNHVLIRQQATTDKQSVTYSLTKKGRAMEPVVKAINDYANTHFSAPAD